MNKFRPLKKFTPGVRHHHTPADLWVKCPDCRKLIYRKHLQDTYKVCPLCEHHFRLPAREWIDLLLDPGSFQEHEAHLEPSDPLSFVSAKDHYTKKLQQMRARSGPGESLICGSGTLEQMSLEIAVANFSFMGGSMGSVYGEKVARAAERAALRAVPLITINTSGGARMHEGIFALMQMAKVSVGLVELARSKQPHISILTDPCYGGVSASYASVADVILAEPGAHIGFAGPRVIEQTIRQKLPPTFQTAEFLLEHGMIDAVVPRPEMRLTLKRLLQIYQACPTAWSKQDTRVN